MLQTLIIKYRLTPKVKDINLAIIESKEVFIYNIYNLNLITIDTYKTTKSYRYNFIIYNFDILNNIIIILGFFWLEAVDFAINFRTKSQRYFFEKAQINLFIIKKFRKEIKRSSTLYYIIIRVIIPLKEQKLFKELNNFANIYNIAFIGVLPKYYSIKYRIDLEKDAILF